MTETKTLEKINSNLAVTVLTGNFEQRMNYVFPWMTSLEQLLELRLQKEDQQYDAELSKLIDLHILEMFGNLKQPELEESLKISLLRTKAIGEKRSPEDISRLVRLHEIRMAIQNFTMVQKFFAFSLRDSESYAKCLVGLDECISTAQRISIAEGLVTFEEKEWSRIRTKTEV